MKQKVLQTGKEYLLILLGSFIYALAFDWLFVPNNIVMGGFTGLAQTINHYLPFLPIGTMVILLNIPLFLLGIHLQGIKLLLSSVFAMLTSSLAVDLLPKFFTFQPIEDHLLVCLFGGAVTGIGLGVQLWVGATTGGTELAATLLKHKFRHIQIGKICLLIDLCVIAFYTITFHSLKDGLYAVIAMYICSSAMDQVIYGRKTSKVACIICSNSEQLRQELLQMDLGITEIQAKGGFTQEDKALLVCAFKPNRIASLKKAVIQKDPTAFVIVCDAQEVYGEGFAEGIPTFL